MALEAGIVGLPGSGKTTLFTALTRTHGGEYGKTHVGMADVPDPRLDALAEVVSAKKITPVAIRVQDVPGTGPALLGNLRQVDAILVVLDGFSPGADPAGELENLKLELLVADRDHVAGGLEPVTTKPLIVVENGPGGIDLALEAELADLTPEDAAAFREGAASALDE